MNIAHNLARVRASLPAGVGLVAVSKTWPAEFVVEAFAAGQRIFGENRPQEMVAKRAALSELLPAGASAASEGEVCWHLIGHLQTNKVRLVAPFVSMIHSVDSARLAREIARQAAVFGRTIDCLLEIRIAREASKEGWLFDELVDWLSGGEWRELSSPPPAAPSAPGIRFRGVMGVASFSDDEALVRSEFERLAEYFTQLKKTFFNSPSDRFDILSMGMSDDYPLAIAAAENILHSRPGTPPASLLVRIGSAIFGHR